MPSSGLLLGVSIPNQFLLSIKTWLCAKLFRWRSLHSAGVRDPAFFKIKVNRTDPFATAIRHKG